MTFISSKQKKFGKNNKNSNNNNIFNNKSNRKKAQSAFEFIMLLGFLFIIFTGMLLVLKIKLDDVNDEREYIFVQRYQNYVLDEITIAESMQNGYIRFFEIPYTFVGEEYEFYIDESNSLILKVRGETYFKILGNNIEGNISKGRNKLIKDEDGIQLEHLE